MNFGKPFRIESYNWILFIILFALPTFYFNFFKEGKDSEAFGLAMGSIISGLIFILFFSYLIWVITKKNQKALNTTFSILLLLSILSGLSSITDSVIEKNGFVDELNEVKQDHYKRLSVNHQENFKSKEILNLEMNAVIDKHLKRNESIKQKNLLRGIKEFLNEAYDHTYGSDIMMDSINMDTFFDIEYLVNNNDYQRQIRIAKNYVIAIKKSEFFLENIDSILISIMENNGVDNTKKNRREILRGYEKGMKGKKELLQNSFFFHQKYGNYFIESIEFLEDKKSTFSFSEGTLFFDHAQDTQKFNNLIDSISKIETEINTNFESIASNN